MKVILAAIVQVFLDWVGFQFLDEAKRLVQSPTVAASTQGYIGLIAIIGATVLGCYLVYNAYKWVKAANQALHMVSTPFLSDDRQGLERFQRVLKEESKGLPPLTPVQFKYRDQVRAELLRILTELYDVSQPKRIAFRSWNETTDHDRKRQNMGNKQQYRTIEEFSTYLNRRNNYVRDKTIRAVEDAEFLHLNNDCIMAYEMMRMEGFLEPDEPAREETEIPRIVVTPAEADSNRLKEFQVRAKDGVEAYPARFYCVTVKNVSGPTVRELEGYFEIVDYEGPKAKVHSGSLLFILSGGADHLTVYDPESTRKQFREAEEKYQAASNSST